MFSDFIDFEIALIVQNKKLWKEKEDGHIKGDSVEAMLRFLISKLVPESYGVSRGWIINEKGERSDERDILIYDKNKVPKFFFEANSGLFPSISLKYDIQVKSSITPSELRKAYEKFKFNDFNKVILSLNGNNLLEEYLKIDSNAVSNPVIVAMSSENDKYYFFSTEKIKFSQIFSPESIKYSLDKKDIVIENIQSEKLIINGHKYSDLMSNEITVSKWCAWDLKKNKISNLRGFFIGLLNTLYGNGIAKYISVDVDEKEYDAKIMTYSISDHLGKVIFSKQDVKNGIPNNFTPKLSILIKEDKSIVLNVVDK